MEVLAKDIENIENVNTNKLQLLYIDFFNGIDREKEIDYIIEQREIIDLMFKSMNGVHEYRMLTDSEYSVANLKIDVNKCRECNSRNVCNDNFKLVCNSCGVVGEYTGSLIIKKNLYNRKTYVKKIINEKLLDLDCLKKHRIIDKCEDILYEFNKRYDTKSFKYPLMFCYILEKLNLCKYVDRFPYVETEEVIKLKKEFYSTLN